MKLTITLQQLIDNKACTGQVTLFRELFGETLSITSKKQLNTLLTEHVSKFDWDWAASNMLSTEGKDAYYKARRAHWDAYIRAVRPHWDAYDKAIQPHLDAYDKAIQPHLDVYNKARQPHLDAYIKAIAITFISLLIKENE